MHVRVGSAYHPKTLRCCITYKQGAWQNSPRAVQRRMSCRDDVPGGIMMGIHVNKHGRDAGHVSGMLANVDGYRGTSRSGLGAQWGDS